MQPNIVFIISDNQSSWTLGCYGNDEIRTPALDGMAREGARFDNAFCVNPVCSPNRATLMTGLMPSQHGVHNWLGTEKPDAQMGPDAYCTIEEFPNLPRMLAGSGYDCGMTGKWHLGDSMHPQLGFRYWFSKPKGHTKIFYNDEAIWEGKVYTEPRYFIDAISHHAVDFLRQPRENPFFLYVGFNGPYGLDHDMYEGHRNRYTEYYADKELKCFPREPAHPWLRQHRKAIMNETAMRSYAAAVSGVDDGVAAILQELEASGQAENTIVVFTADHGLCGGHHGMWGMGDHSRPMHMFQENLRVPLIYRHPARISAGLVVDKMVNHYDFLPSISSYMDHPEWLAGVDNLPGRDYSPALDGRDVDLGEEIVFHEYETVRALQTREWKLIRRYPDGPDELYNMIDDPGERNNLADDPAYSEIFDRFSGRIDEFFARYCNPEYDIPHGGRSKAGRMTDIKL